MTTKTADEILAEYRDNCRWVRECVDRCRAADADLIEALNEQRGSYDRLLEALDGERPNV